MDPLDMNSTTSSDPGAASSNGQLDYRLLVATIRDPLLVISPDGVILAANHPAAIMLETPPRAGDLLWGHVPMGMVYDYAGVVDTVVLSCRSIRFEQQVGGRWFEISVEPMLGKADQTMAVLVHGRDITARRQIEACHRASEALLSVIIDHLPELIYWKDQQGRFLGCNRAFAEANGLTSPEEVRGKTDWDFLPPGQATSLHQQDSAVMTEHRCHRAEQTLNLLTGDQAVEKAKLPLFTESGDVMGVLSVAQKVNEAEEK
ncbi:PAS domain-containing protein [Skermanella rosea]|uniref:PAS domain-containing protein n=1 Tax=Skermanella rosea TaxID=1817965 RepID=UPI001932F039|nr:PAS domain-containing protein [Skermanella rosea]UEM03275.1 PAS domain-containing protein [Skermanella rosea]